jgi:cytochrome c oxidase subunit 2
MAKKCIPAKHRLRNFFMRPCGCARASAALPENGVAPFNYFLHSFGPASMSTMHLGWVFVAHLLAILVTITLLLAVAILHKRPAKDPDPMDREDKKMLWIYIGTAISTCILFALAIYSLITLNGFRFHQHPR